MVSWRCDFGMCGGFAGFPRWLRPAPRFRGRSGEITAISEAQCTPSGMHPAVGSAMERLPTRQGATADLDVPNLLASDLAGVGNSSEFQDLIFRNQRSCS
ncbi:hypothetical protein MES5069_430024 [Mesorhizobium escarrei]|uniref:Uncharacterized protein n=1 Tax=Mesorhizobium escarrei TaxID=666018 RepID=A0ABN8K2W5_9HYPH|nr:hypothetical protein MES5069_430024 [Mesorhizobium escarrei]